MPLKPLGKPPYLLPIEIEQDDIVEIIDKPYIVPADKTKWGKERGKAQIRILRNGQERTWTMNNTTFDKLLRAFGEDPGLWLGKKVQITKEMRNVSGVDKEVLFGKAFKEPQQQLNPEEHFNPNLSHSKPLQPSTSELALTPQQKAELTQLIDQEKTEPLTAFAMVLTKEQMAKHTIGELMDLWQAEVK